MAIDNNKSINDLPLELLREILLRLPVKSLSLLRRVSKTWLHLISDPNFAKSHFELAAAPTRRCLLIRGTRALSYDLDALFRKGYAPGKVSLRCMEPSAVNILESCRGFILLDQCPHLIIWNPSTGAHRRISYSHIGSLSKGQMFQYLRNVLFSGFGYDSSEDDYLVVLAWRDKNREDHFDFFSTRTNSWKSFEVALPNSLMGNVRRRCGLFLNGAFHWLACYHPGDDYILIFDLMGRCFSEIPLPKRLPISGVRHLVELEGCLALCFWNNECKYEIWVMKEYKVQSSWTWYGIFGRGFNPLGISIDGDIVGFDFIQKGFSKYSVSGNKLEHCGHQLFVDGRYTMYTHSLMSLPNDLGHPDCQECSAQLDAGKRKRIKRAPTWIRDFYCN